MHKVLISLASNHEQEKNLGEARKALAQVLHSPVYTPAIWTVPFGKQGMSGLDAPQYLNQLVTARTSLSADLLTARLKEVELAQGRSEDMRRQGIVTVDLDLLQHDDHRFHLRDWQRPYVRELLPPEYAELCG